MLPIFGQNCHSVVQKVMLRSNKASKFIKIFIDFDRFWTPFLGAMLGQNGLLSFTQVCFWAFLCVLTIM